MHVDLRHIRPTLLNTQPYTYVPVILYVLHEARNESKIGQIRPQVSSTKQVVSMQLILSSLYTFNTLEEDVAPTYSRNRSNQDVPWSSITQLNRDSLLERAYIKHKHVV